MINLFLILLALLLVLLNGFFVAAEFGMVKLRHTRIAAIKKQYGLRGRILGDVHQNLDAYLSACQLGITLASLGLGWIGEPAIAALLEPLLGYGGQLAQEMVVVLSFLIAFSVLSFLHIVLGELVPKSLAIRQSERISLWTATPLYVFYWVMFPAIWLLNACANFVLKLTKINDSSHSEQAYTPEEIKLILNSSHIHEKVTKQEIDMLKHTLQFAELKVVDVMRPFDDMQSLSAQFSIDTAIQQAIQLQYSRYPVYQQSSSDINGIVHVKDLLIALHQGKQADRVSSIMRPVLKVSWHLPVLKLLNQLQKGMPHFAVVYSNTEMPVGFVTLDNLFQVLIGRVRDEFHKTGEAWTKADDGAFIMNGNASLYVLERALEIEIEKDNNDEPVDTIYGLILTKLGRLPQQGERIEFDAFSLVVMDVKGYKIKQVAIYPRNVNTGA